jgi:hypothetical protein
VSAVVVLAAIVAVGVEQPISLRSDARETAIIEHRAFDPAGTGHRGAGDNDDDAPGSFAPAGAFFGTPRRRTDLIRGPSAPA